MTTPDARDLAQEATRIERIARRAGLIGAWVKPPSTCDMFTPPDTERNVDLTIRFLVNHMGERRIITVRAARESDESIEQKLRETFGLQ